MIFTKIVQGLRNPNTLGDTCSKDLLVGGSKPTNLTRSSSSKRKQSSQVSQLSPKILIGRSLVFSVSLPFYNSSTSSILCCKLSSFVLHLRRLNPPLSLLSLPVGTFKNPLQYLMLHLQNHLHTMYLTNNLTVR